MASGDIHQKVKAQFGRTAEAYVSSKGHAKGADLQLMVEVAGEVEGLRALDIATGGGHTALAFAKAGAIVTATDLTPTMLERASEFITAELGEDADRARFELAAAEDLPFADASYEIVTCRIAPHHFADPEAFVREVARVLVPGGRFFLIDNIAPEDPAWRRR